MAEDRRDIAIAEEDDGDDDERERETAGEERRARADDSTQREDREREERPAEQVMEERGTLEEPVVLLVDQEGHTGDDECGDDGEPPERAAQLPAGKPELRGARDHHHLGPGAVGEHVQRRRGEEAQDGPHREAHREHRRGPEVRPPAALPPDLPADDRLGDQEEAEREEAGREQPVNMLGRRHHCSTSSSSPRSSSRPGTTRKWNSAPTRMTRSCGSTKSHQNPWSRGWRMMRRYGCSRAQTIPAVTVAGPIAERAYARAVRRLGASRGASVAICVIFLPDFACWR